MIAIWKCTMDQAGPLVFLRASSTWSSSTSFERSSTSSPPDNRARRHPPRIKHIEAIYESGTSSNSYFLPSASSAASKTPMTASTFSSSNLRPTTCTATGSPAILTAS